MKRKVGAVMTACLFLTTIWYHYEGRMNRGEQGVDPILCNRAIFRTLNHPDPVPIVATCNYPN